VKPATRRMPCPICHGHRDLPGGRGVRCWGFVSDDGAYAHCTREELAGEIRLHKDGTYPHRLGPRSCRCGRTHEVDPGQAIAMSTPIGVAAPEIVEAYDYHDERAKLVYQVVRYQPKAFRQRQPNGAGGWVWNLDGVEPLLYRLPDVIRAVAAGDTIWIVEGEKDADAMNAAGCVATCNSGGAGKWPGGQSRHLAGADVVIVRDKDEVGNEHARQVFSALKPIAKSLRVVEARTGKDAADHLAAKHTVEQFVPVYPSADLRATDPIAWKRRGLRLALDATGRARRDEAGRLIRRNAGEVSLFVVRSSAPAERLYDVEGESDALACIDAGATDVFASTGGASTLKGHERWVDALLASPPKEVVVVGDLGGAGSKGAGARAKWWRNHGVSVRVLKLPTDLGPGGDVRDYLMGRPARQGEAAQEPRGGFADLDALADAAPRLPPIVAREPTEKPGLELISFGELLAEPEERVRWIADGLLIAGGLSLLAGKPKAGKSTLARALAVAVAHGTPFLDRPVTAGRVIYCAFEDKRSELRRVFSSLGANAETSLDFVVGRAPEGVVDEVDRIAREKKPALIVIDTLARFAGIRDLNDYSEVTRALEPVVAIARETGAHVLLVHHAKKGSGSDPDGILGSTALFGTVDTALVLRRHEGVRLLSSRQRYGSDMAETVIDRDHETGQLRAGGTREEREKAEVEARIVAYLGECVAPVSEAELDASVEGTKAVKVRALRALHAREAIARTGAGRRGDPYLYALADSGFLVRDPRARTSELETRNDEAAALSCGEPLAFEEGRE